MTTLAVRPEIRASLGPAVARFFSGCFRHSKGPMAGKSFVLEPWQREDIDLIYELDAAGRRIWREVLWGIPRSNGKSPTVAGCGIFELMERRDSPDIFIGAGSRGQAGILKGFAADFVTGGALADYVRVQRNALICARNRGVMQTVSADGDLQMGLSLSAGLLDEFHVFKTRKQEEVYWAFVTALQKRTDSLLAMITTAGQSRRTLCGELFDAMLEAPDVERFDVGRAGDGCLLVAKDRDAGRLMIWRGAPDEADVADPQIWRSANPASWVPDSELARMMSSLPESIARRLILNQWAGLDDSAITPAQWDSCRDAKAAQIPDRADVWIAVAMSERCDSGVLAAIGRPLDDGRRPVQFELVGPTADGSSCGAEMQALVRVACERWRHQSFVFNGLHFGQEAIELGREGLNLWKAPGATQAGFREIDDMMVPASRDLVAAIVAGEIAHDGDRDVRAQVLAAEASVRRAAWRIVRPGPDRDGTPQRGEAAIALAMAHQATQSVQPEPMVAFA